MPARPAGAVFVVVLFSGCGGGSSPVVPTPRVTTAPALLKAGMTVSSALASSGGYHYEIQLEISESAGVAVTLECVEIWAGDWGDPVAVACGADVWPDGNVVPAGGALKSKPIVIEEEFPYEYYAEFAATISFRDGPAVLSKSFLVNAKAPDIPRPQAGARFGMTGVVFEQGTGRQLDGVTIQVVSGKNAGRRATTDIEGRYAFTGLEPDGLSVEFSRPGYTGTGTWVELASNRTLHYQLGRQN